MAIPEVYQGLAEKGVTSDGCFFHANFVFEGFRPTSTEIDLTLPLFEELTALLTMPRFHPKEAMVIFDEKGTPRLIVAFGERERWGDPSGYGREEEHLGDVDYLHIHRVNPEDDHVFVEGTTDFHPFEDRANGFEVSYYLSRNHRAVGTIMLRKEGEDLVLKAEQDRNL